MNPDIQGSGRLDGGDANPVYESLHRGGSVKRARQRASAGLPPEFTGDGTHPLVLSRPANAPSSPTPNLTDIPGFTDPWSQTGQVPSLPIRTGQRPSPPAIRMTGGSPPTSPRWSLERDSTAPRPLETDSMASWPLEMGSTTPRPLAMDLTAPRPLGKGPPPQRPPRPSYVPPLLPPDSLAERFRILQQQFQAAGDPDSPNQVSPSSPSSSASFRDFPIPAIAPLNIQQKRILGPPPSARKGSSSYYSQNSLVTPILEESSEAHGSGHVVSSGWGDDTPDYHTGGRISEEEASTDGRRSRPGDHEESTGLVPALSTRKGKRRKRSSQPMESGMMPSEESGNVYHPRRSSGGRRLHPKALTPGTRSRDSAIERESHQMKGRTDEGSSSLVPAIPLPGNAPFPSPTSPLPDVPLMQARPGSRSAVDPQVNQIMGNLEKGGAIPSNDAASPQTSMGSPRSERPPKRPPRLNLSKEAEARASQTSLPELIRRATRLAANLERARTASRVGLIDIIGSAKSSRAGSISDILAAFPSPSIVTPPSARWQTSTKTKSSLVRVQAPPMPDSKSEGGPTKSRSRKCCGMPLWVFLLLLGILVLLIAAAVVIPITLIVLPRMRNNPPSLASCKRNAHCDHGASHVVADRSCRCICANGYTGSTCATAGDQSCTFLDIDVGQTGFVYQNATVGNGIARVLAESRSNFSIPLDSSILLSRFSSSNLSCVAENLLVTFNGKFRRSLPMQFVSPDIDLAEKPSFSLHSALPQITRPPSNPHHHHPRIAALENPAGAAITSNDIVFAAPSVTPNDGAQTTSPTARPTATGSSVKPSSNFPQDSNPQGIPAKALDFARVAVLFIFQEKTLNLAVAANTRLQAVLLDPTTWNTSAVFAADTVLVDFGKWTIDLGNGTVYGLEQSAQ